MIITTIRDWARYLYEESFEREFGIVQFIGHYLGAFLLMWAIAWGFLALQGCASSMDPRHDANYWVAVSKATADR